MTTEPTEPYHPEAVHVGDVAHDLLRAARTKASLGSSLRGPRNRPTRTAKGRTRLHPVLQERICDSIRRGNFVETACVGAGVSKATFYAWQRRGLDARSNLLAGLPVEPGDRVFLDFLDATEAARAEMEQTFVEAHTRLSLGGEVSEIIEHFNEDGMVIGRTIRFSKPDRQAIEWHLSHALPASWGKTQVELAGPEQGPISVEVATSARDALREKLGLAAERMGLTS